MIKRLLVITYSACIYRDKIDSITGKASLERRFDSITGKVERRYFDILVPVIEKDPRLKCE